MKVTTFNWLLPRNFFLSNSLQLRSWEIYIVQMYIVIHVSQTAIFRCCVMFMSNDIIIIVAFVLKNSATIKIYYPNNLSWKPLSIRIINSCSLFFRLREKCFLYAIRCDLLLTIISWNLKKLNIESHCDSQRYNIFRKRYWK